LQSLVGVLAELSVDRILCQRAALALTKNGAKTMEISTSAKNKIAVAAVAC